MLLCLYKPLQSKWNTHTHTYTAAHSSDASITKAASLNHSAKITKNWFQAKKQVILQLSPRGFGASCGLIRLIFLHRLQSEAVSSTARKSNSTNRADLLMKQTLLQYRCLAPQRLEGPSTGSAAESVSWVMVLFKMHHCISASHAGETHHSVTSSDHNKLKDFNVLEN